MAEVLLRRALERRLGPDASYFAIQSAGTAAIDGCPASEGARQVLEEAGLEVSEHRARALDRALLEWADLVVALSDSHRRAIQTMTEGEDPPVIKLAEEDVEDPIGKDVETYRRCLRMIEAGVEKLAQKLSSALKEARRETARNEGTDDESADRP